MTLQQQVAHLTDAVTAAEVIGGYLTGLQPTVRNLTSAAKALARIDELGWAPLGGYPGSDVLWPVRCLVCGWEGTRFYSHLRRARPASRHPGCLSKADHPAVLAKLAERARSTCECSVPHAITPAQVAQAFDAVAQAQVRGNVQGLVIGLDQLLSPCPANGARAAAVAAHVQAANCISEKERISVDLYLPGDRVAVQYLSKNHGPGVAYNRTVIDTEPHDRHGPQVWVHMPDDAVYDSPLQFSANSDRIALMESTPIEVQSPALLAANLSWHLAVAAPNSMKATWPHPRSHALVKESFTDAERTGHASVAAQYIRQWRQRDPVGFSAWQDSCTTGGV
ncbi:hypothetical protein OG453_06995 [Streptomyces sp. NBC_01381]|uniref:hypothetical protein n=1 Tax=Streptomyces sp. NBC_01381 TaxID=2903845 RepID=UPI00224DC134|nr:hypothetical protein [Streptomyces sp. NBC_01381]MCX4666414.1 hypothetical protein [Streptomyces sp. NBC_01381]